VNGGNGRVTGVFRSRRSPNLWPGGFSDRKRYPNENITRTSDFEIFVSLFPVRILI